jgi:hypothetical protein
VGAKLKELCEAGGGRLEVRGGVTGCVYPSGTPDFQIQPLKNAATNRAVVEYHSLQNPPQRPINYRRKDYFHLKTVTALPNVLFFDVVPAIPAIDGNFLTAGIKQDMEVFGIRALIDPASYQDVGSDYCEVFNLINSGSWELLINNTPVVDGRIQEISPFQDWREANTAGNWVLSLNKSEFYYFEKEDKSGYDKLVVSDKDVVYVRATFATALTTKSGMKIGFQLADRPAVRAVLL